MFAAAFTGGITYFQKKRDEYFAERDAVLRHYVELHPEDFNECQGIYNTYFEIYTGYLLYFWRCSTLK